MDTSNAFGTPLEESSDPTEVPVTQAPSPVSSTPPTEGAGSLMDKAAELGKDALQGVAHGAESAVRGVRQGVRAIGAPIADALGAHDQADLMREDMHYGTAKPETIAGDITAGLTEAGLSWVAGGAVLKGVGLAAKVKGTTVAGAAIQTGIGSMLTTDPNHERLSNVLAQYPVIGPAFDLLATKPTDNAVIAKAKSVLEESFTAAGAAGIFKGIHVLALKLKGAPPATIAKAEDELIKAQPKEASAGQATSTSEGKALTLDQSLASNVRTTSGQVAEYKQVKMSDLAVRESDHMNTSGKNPVDPAKVTAFAERIKAGDSKKMPPIDVTTDPLTGEMRILDGRHRVAAAQAEGYDTITAKVLRDKNAKELVGELPPITILRPSGEPIVTLTPAMSTRFQNLQDKLIIKSEMGAIPTPRQGLDESAAKEGVPLRPNLRNAPEENLTLQGLADLGKLTKSQLNSGVETEEMTRATAAMYQSTPEKAMANLRALNISLEDGGGIMVGVAQLMQTQGKIMSALAKKALLGDMDARELHKKVYVGLSGVQAEFAQTQTLLGRTMHSLGYSTKPFDQAKLLAKLSTPEDAERIERLMVAADGNPDKVAAIIAMQNMSAFQKAVGIHNEVWTGLGLLSRFSTQAINGLSTGINTMMTPASMIMGGTMKGLTGNGFESAKMGLGIYAGMRTAFFDSVSMSWAALKSGEAIISKPGTMEVKQPFVSSMAFNMNPDHFHAKMIDYFGELTRASFRALTAGDEFWKQLNYRAYVASKASMDAADLVRAGKLGKDDVHKHVSDALQASIDDQLRGIVPDALKYAEKTSFVNDLKIPTLGGFPSIGELSARAASHPIIRGTILPFVKTPTNVTRTTWEYTPVIGQIRKAFWADMKTGGHVQAEAIGKMTLGTGFYLGAMHLALEGRITGAPPAPGVLVPPGWQPYSAVFPGYGTDGGDLYLSYQRLQPFGDILGLSVDFAKSAGMLDPDTRDNLADSMKMAMMKFMEGTPAEKWEMGTNIAIGAAASQGKSVISKTYFRNMTEFFSTFSGYNNEDKVVRWFQNYAASHVPGMLSQFNGDETMREVRSTLDAIMARIPGLSQNLAARRDYVGRINDTKIGLPYSAISPLSAKSTKPDEVFDELQRLSNSSAEGKFEEMEKSYTINGHRQDLKLVKNDAGISAYDRMNEIFETIKPAGETKTFHQKLSEVMHESDYALGRESATLDGSPDIQGHRIKAIKAEELRYRSAALEQVKNEFKSQLGIESAFMDTANMKLARKKVGAGLYDKLLDLGK